MKRAINRVAVTGLGVCSAIGSGLDLFSAGLKSGKSNFSTTQISPREHGSFRITASINDCSWPDWLEFFRERNPLLVSRARKIFNNAPDSARISARSAMEALLHRGMDGGFHQSESTGIIVAGSNLHQEFCALNQVKFQTNSGSINPRYALNFWDTHQVGCLTELFGVGGMSYTLGGASASGNVALVQAFESIRSGSLESCLVLGSSPELSALEFHALDVMGAVSPEARPEFANRACRPFDRDHQGFVFGQGGAAIFLENLEVAKERGAALLAELAGGAVVMSGNHLSNASLKPEVRAMTRALAASGQNPESVDYVNAHGTSTPMGDAIECQAVHEVFGGHAKNIWINSTKSLTGHCLGASSLLELVACVVQMNDGFLHPNLNLENPIDSELRFVGSKSVPVSVQTIMSNAFGFGGFNSSVVIRKLEN